MTNGGSGYPPYATTFTIPTGNIIDDTATGAIIPIIDFRGKMVAVLHPRDLELETSTPFTLTASTTGTAPGQTASVTVYPSAPMIMSSGANEIIPANTVVGFKIVDGKAYETFNTNDY